MPKTNITDYTSTFLALQVLNLVICNGFLDVNHNFKLLSKLIRVNSKFYEEFQSHLSCMEERLSKELKGMLER